jgi:hypothetical protein
MTYIDRNRGLRESRAGCQRRGIIDGVVTQRARSGQFSRGFPSPMPPRYRRGCRASLSSRHTTGPDRPTKERGISTGRARDRPMLVANRWSHHRGKRHPAQPRGQSNAARYRARSLYGGLRGDALNDDGPDLFGYRGRRPRAPGTGTSRMVRRSSGRVFPDAETGHRVAIGGGARPGSFGGSSWSADAAGFPARLSSSHAVQWAGCRLVDIKRSAAVIHLHDTLSAPDARYLRGLQASWQCGQPVRVVATLAAIRMRRRPVGRGEVFADDDQVQAQGRESWMPGGTQTGRPSR